MSIFDFEPVLAGKIISVITIDRAEDAEPLAQALIDGGLDALEITFRTEAAPAQQPMLRVHSSLRATTILMRSLPMRCVCAIAPMDQ